MTTAYLTPEEFNSSTTPLPSILVPRSQAVRLVELCELAEMTPSAGFLDFVVGNDNDAADDSSNNGGAAHPHALVTQMALLLYLGEYSHARHLWRRHRRKPSLSSPSSEAAAGADDRAQLEMLWNAAKYCYLWSTGGIHSLNSSPSGDSGSPSENGGMMQVEDADNNSDESSPSSSDLPFSTMALRAFQSCCDDKEKSAEPLSTYSAELVGVFRSRVNRQLHQTFDRLEPCEFCLRMNLERGSGGEGGDRAWESFGWKEEGGYLVSNIDGVLMDADAGDDVFADGSIPMGAKDRIGKLTDVVMFLEGKMNA